MCLEDDIQVTFILINLWNLRIINSNFTCLVFFSVHSTYKISYMGATRES